MLLVLVLLKLMGPGSLMLLLLVPHVTQTHVLKFMIKLAHVHVLVRVRVELPLLAKELSHKLNYPSTIALVNSQNQSHGAHKEITKEKKSRASYAFISTGLKMDYKEKKGSEKTKRREIYKMKMKNLHLVQPDPA